MKPRITTSSSWFSRSVVGAIVPGALLCAAACGGEETAPAPIPVDVLAPPEVQVVSGTPSPPDEDPDGTSYPAFGYVVALGALGSTTVVGTTVEASSVGETDLETIEIWGAGPPTTGHVRAILRRSSNVLVATETGVFHTLDDKLVLSPASDILSGLDIRSMHLASGTSTEEIWVVAADGLYQLEDEELSRWNIDGTIPLDITDVLVTRQEATIAFGGSLYTVDLNSKRASLVDYDFGNINALLTGPGGVLQLATSQGLYERVSDDEFVQYTLADGSAVAEVHDVVLDPKQGSFAVTSSGVLLASGGAIPIGAATLPESTAPRVLAFDDIGNLWVGDDQTVHAFKLGTPLSFETDIKPILDEYCMSCHGDPPKDNTPGVDFNDYGTSVEYAAAIVLRVGTGQMPPAGSPPVSPENFEMIKRWHEGGTNP